MTPITAGDLRTKADALRALGSTIYNQQLREVIWETAFVFLRSAMEIERLERENEMLRRNSPTQ